MTTNLELHSTFKVVLLIEINHNPSNLLVNYRLFNPFHVVAYMPLVSQVTKFRITNIRCFNVLSEEGLFAWGNNTHNQLALETEKVRSLPIQIPIPNKTITSVSCGEYHTICCTGTKQTTSETPHTEISF